MSAAIIRRMAYVFASICIGYLTQGLITITDGLTVRVSKRLEGTSYYNLSGTKIWLPSEEGLRPSASAIVHRNKEEFRD